MLCHDLEVLERCRKGEEAMGARKKGEWVGTPLRDVRGKVQRCKGGKVNEKVPGARCQVPGDGEQEG